LPEVQDQAGDSERNAGHAQEREAGDARDLPRLRYEGVSNREGVGPDRTTARIMIILIRPEREIV
jgi:hypothetical protein